MWGTTSLFSKVGPPFCIASSSQPPRIPISLHPRQHLLSPVLLIIVILVGVKWYLIMVFICIFFMVNTVQYLFMCSWPLASLLVYLNFWPLKIGLFVHFYWVMGIFMYSGYFFLDLWFANIFSHSMGYLFIFLIVSSEAQKFWTLMIYSFVICTLSKKPFLILGHENLCLCSLLRGLEF